MSNDAFMETYVVVEEGVTSWGEKYDRKVRLGYPLSGDDSRIPYTIPRPKDLSDVMNHGLPVEDQKWVREKIMPEFSRRAIALRAETEFGENHRWWENAENLTKAMSIYLLREIRREEEGLYLMINGRLTYITGLHYSYLKWSKMKDGTYPDYRDRDRRWFYAWQACTEDPMCDGMVYLKHRQDGATSRGGHIALSTATKYRSASVVIRDSLGFEHGKEMIWNKVMKPMWLGWPVFKRPDVGGKEWNDGGSITFAKHITRGKNKKADDDYGLMSSLSIATASGGQSKADGGTLKFILVDEFGKDPEDIDSKWGTEQPTLKNAGGKALHTSTVEEKLTDAGSSIRAAKFCRDADRALITTNPNGKTSNGLYFYFVPCYDGLDFEWIGPYGESIMGMPTEQQVDYLKGKYMAAEMTKNGGDEEKALESWERKSFMYRRGGSYQAVLDKYAACSTDRDRSNERRRFPMTPDDALMPSADSAYFNQEILLGAISELSRNVNGQPYWKKLVRTGNFEWKERGVLTAGKFSGMSIPKFGGEVHFVDYPEDHPRARFHVSTFLPEIHAKYETVRRVPSGDGSSFYSAIIPNNSHLFRIGLDILEFDKSNMKERDSKLSKMGAHCKWMDDMEADAGIEAADEDEFCMKQVSNRYMFDYIARPDDIYEAFEDIIKAAIFYGARINVEKDRSGVFVKYCQDRGLMPLLMRDTPAPGSGTPNTKKDIIGSSANHKENLQLLAVYITKYVRDVKKFPFMRTLKQLLDARIDNIGKRDLVASMEMTEKACLAPRVQVARSAKKTELAVEGEGAPAKVQRRTNIPVFRMN